MSGDEPRSVGAPRPLDATSKPFASPIRDIPSRGASSPSLADKSTATIRIRLNHPVEGVHQTPFSFLRDSGGTVIDGKDPTIRWSWYRSTTFRACANDRCPRSDEDVHAAYQCAECVDSGAPVSLSYFCSIDCMRDAWHRHARHGGPQGRRDFQDRLRLTHRATGGEPLSAAIDRKAQLLKRLADGPAAPHKSEPTDWKLISTDAAYTPSAADVWHRLRLTCRAELGAASASEYTVETNFVLPMPPEAPPRKWLRGVRPDIAGGRPFMSMVSPTGDRSHPHAFRVVSYNILAEIYATQTVYPYCPIWAINFDFRKRLILKELKHYDADVLCLQEVQENFFKEVLEPEMNKAGYEGWYKAKTRPPMGPGRIDGCGMFFKAGRFKITEKYVIEFNEAARSMGEELQAAGMTKADADKQVGRLSRDNVAQVALLELTHSPTGEPLSIPQRLCCANTHLFWDPEYTDVKVWQTHMLIKELEKFVTPRDIPLVLCGDFNSSPGSAVHKLLISNSALGRTQVSLRSGDLPKDPCNILSARGPLSHSLFICSAYAAVSGTEPEHTNYTREYVGVLDYVWFSSSAIEVRAALIPPSEPILQGYSGKPLPNAQFPSDHLAIAFDMVLGSSMSYIHGRSELRPDIELAPRGAVALPVLGVGGKPVVQFSQTSTPSGGGGGGSGGAATSSHSHSRHTSGPPHMHTDRRTSVSRDTRRGGRGGGRNTFGSRSVGGGHSARW